MLKTMESGVTWNYPLDKKSNIKCEGHRGFWTILDAATYHNEVYVLLEHNDYGDETPFLLAILPCACLRWYVVEKMNDKQEKSFFIREKDILEEGWDSIEHLIIDAYNGKPELGDIKFWTDEEINTIQND
jgi:hypothetical protein